MKTTYGFFNPLHKMTFEDPFREVYSRIYFENGYAYVTNGHALVKMPIKDISSFSDEAIKRFDKSSVSAKVFKCLYRSQKSIEVLENGFQVEEILYKFRREEKPPVNYEKVLTRLSGNEPVQDIGLNVYLLSIFGEVFKNSKLILKFNSNKNAVVVRPTLGESIGIIMPFMHD